MATSLNRTWVPPLRSQDRPRIGRGDGDLARVREAHTYKPMYASPAKSALEFYEGGCQEKVSPSDGQKKFSSTSRPFCKLPRKEVRRSCRIHGSVETTSAATGDVTSQPGVKDAHDGSIRDSGPTALSGGARGPSVRRRLAPWWPLPKLQVETHPQPSGLAVWRSSTGWNPGAEPCKLREARLLVLFSVAVRRNVLLSSTESKPRSRSCARW